MTRNIIMIGAAPIPPKSDSARDPSHRPHLRGLQRDLVDAADAKIMRVVAMVDRMDDRSAADALIAPLRLRLAQLRPQRPLGFVRLVFTPLDPLVVPGPKWRRGSLGIPRTALACLGAVVHAGLGDERAAIEARIAGVTTEHADAIAEAGGTLWPLAASILATAAMPANWNKATGLQAEDFHLLASTIAALFAQAGAAQRVVTLAKTGTPLAPRDLEAVLAALVPAGSDAVAMMASVLMARLPRPEALVAVSDDLASQQSDQAIRAAADRAVDFVLDGIEARPAAGANVAQAATEIGRIVTMLNDLNSRPGQRPARRARIDQLRRKIDSDCRAQFANELDARLLHPAAALESATDVEITALESIARDLRRFESQARLLGGGEQYDRALSQAARRLHPTPQDAPATMIDRVRLVEILQGPEAALALLAAAA